MLSIETRIVRHSTFITNKWSGRQDSNLRPPGPKPEATEPAETIITVLFGLSQEKAQTLDMGKPV
jgi:hypothetical protein